jgi:hypothetical protein
MRYLFGDSTPFPLPFDFLRTLEAFVSAGTRVVLLEHEARAVAADAFSAQRERAEGLEALGRFHAAVLQSFAGAALPQHPYAFEYTQRLAEHAALLVDERRRVVQEADGADAARVRSERERADGEIGRLLRTFFQDARLPVAGTWLESSLVDGRPEARASLTHPEGIGVSFTLGTARAPSWSAPRRVADLVGHLELVVGIKKSWIGGKVRREPVRLDDWVVGSAEISAAAATIALRRKPDQKDTLVFKLRRDAGGLAADVEHPSDPNAGLLPQAADPADLPHLERLWTALRATFDEVLEERAAILRVSLDGEDAVGNRRGQELVARIVGVLAPTTLEIARRSPSARELSLKREAVEGRREELYLERAALLAALAPLSPEGRRLFAPLGLEDPFTMGETPKPPPQASTAVLQAPRAPDGRDELTSLDIEEG